ncbi:MAG: right-handed parallel beta-helix repeat-containing protein [Thermomicrobiales bacterium]
MGARLQGRRAILFAENPGADHNERVFVHRGRFTANHRGGIAITDVDTAVLDQCVATHNDGTAPRFGLDIEPDFDASTCRNILVVGGDYSFNGGSVSGEGAGIYIVHRAGGAATQRGVRIIGARMRGNALHGLICGLNPTVARDVEVIGCEISENAALGGGGVEFRGGENFRMIGCHLRDNAAFGVSVGVPGLTATNTTILDTFVRGDDTAGAVWSFGGTVDGVLVDGLVTENNGWGLNFGAATVTNLRLGARNLLKDNSVADLANIPASALFEPADLKGSKTFDWPSINAGSQSTTTVTVTGAALGDVAEASMSVDLQGMQLTAYVSALNTVTCVMRNGTAGAINLASGTLRVRVRKA